MKYCYVIALMFPELCLGFEHRFVEATDEQEAYTKGQELFPDVFTDHRAPDDGRFMNDLVIPLPDPATPDVGIDSGRSRRDLRLGSAST